VTHLDLSYNKIGDEGASALAKLCSPHHGVLVDLCLEGNCIGPAGANVLAKAVRASAQSPLRHLNLRLNPFGPRGGAAIASALEQRGVMLQTLNLAATGLGLDGARTLAHALPRTGLHVLDVSCNAIGEDGARALAAAADGLGGVVVDARRNAGVSEGTQQLLAIYATRCAGTTRRSDASGQGSLEDGSLE
jgi:Ran GTPase-activating protein (RanGAP) involved in mRNA processing and transport